MENILDFIKVYKGAVSNELCDDIVNKYKDSDKFKLSETIGGLERKIRNCYLLDLLDDKDIDGRLFKEQSINIKAKLFVVIVSKKTVMQLHNIIQNLSIIKINL